MAKMSFDEKKWQADSDAETLARYQEIMADASRRKAAMKVANDKAARLEKAANNMKLAAGGKLKK